MRGESAVTEDIGAATATATKSTINRIIFSRSHNQTCQHPEKGTLFFKNAEALTPYSNTVTTRYFVDKRSSCHA